MTTRRFRLASALLLGAALPSLPRGTYVNEAFGFRLELPAGWSAKEVEAGAAALHVVLSSAREGAFVQLAVRAFPRAQHGGPEDLRALAVSATEGREGYSEPVLGTARIGDAVAPSFEVVTSAGGTRLKVHQRYAAGNGTTYLLQSIAPPDEHDRLEEGFERVWSSFELVDLPHDKAEEQGLLELAARCGSEVAWAATWADAAARARAERKLVLVSARFYPGFNISDATMTSVFMDPDVVELIDERYVPFRLHARALDVPFADPEVYGLSRTTFGAAVLLVTPEGRVVREASSSLYEFLVESLARHPEYPGRPAEAREDPIDRAELCVRRGELEAAEALLEGRDSARAHLLMASVRRRARDCEWALAELERARRAPGAAGLAVEIDLDLSLLLARCGRAGEAAPLLERVVAEHADHARFPEALYRLGSLRLELAGRAEAERVWKRLIADHAESRWAWQAAARMTDTAYRLGRHERLDWPAEELYERLRVPDPEPLASEAVGKARADALAWLVASQLEDGSWLTPTELGRRAGSPPDDFHLAITAICAQALLAHRDEPEPAVALERALDWLLPAYEKARAAGGEVHFMDYGVWSRAYVLWLLADCVEAGLRGRGAIRPVARVLLDELEEKQRPGGGWSYYVTGDLGSESPSPSSISFTTAAVVLALVRAREARLPVPEEMLERGLECLEGMRVESGVFEYFDAGGARGAGPGGAGRGPVCALALHRGGRGSLDELRRALDFFMAHRAGLDKELGKTLMHTGPDGQGSHYLLFDYACAAAAIAALPERERERYREPVIELVLHARRAGGAFVDNPTRGAAFGAGMGLLALDRLRAGS